MDKKTFESLILKSFRRSEAAIRKRYKKDTGRDLPEVLDLKSIKDMWDRYFFLILDPDFKQNDIRDEIDGIASGAACELKYNTYGYNNPRITDVVIDVRKINTLLDASWDARVVFLYPDFERKEIGVRQFLARDIKKYGRINTKDGRVDNDSCEESNKPVYRVSHGYAEASYIWKQNDWKS